MTATSTRPHTQFFPTDQAPSRTDRALVGIAFTAFAAPAAIAARIGPRTLARWSAGMQRLERRAPVPALKPGTHVAQIGLPRCDAELVRAPGVAADRWAILYLHGGGFVGGAARTYRPFVARLSRTTETTILNVDYRLMPGAKLADTISDGVDGYRWLLEHGYTPEQIIVAGDSAGGHLAFSVPLKIVTDGLPAPAGIVAISPWLDFDSRTKRAHANAKLDPMIHVGGIDFVVRRLIAEEGRLDPLLSPVNGPLAELPPCLIQVGSTEVLRVDSELMAQRLTAASVPCRLQVWEHQMHCFQVLGGRRSQAHAALGEIGSFVRERLSP